MCPSNVVLAADPAPLVLAKTAHHVRAPRDLFHPCFALRTPISIRLISPLPEFSLLDCLTTHTFMPWESATLAKELVTTGTLHFFASLILAYVH